MNLRHMVPFIVEDVSKASIIVFYVLALLSLYQSYTSRGKIFSRILKVSLLTVVIISIFSSVVGLLNGFGEKILPDIFNSISGLTVALAAYNLKLTRRDIEQFLEKYSLFFFCAFVISLIILVTGSSLGMDVYPALVPNGLIVCYLLWKNQKRWFLVVITLFLLLFSMKRSIIIISLSTVCIFMVIDRFGYTLKSMFYGFVFICFSLTLTLGVSASLDGVARSGVILPGVLKINQLNPFLPSKMISWGSGVERIKEVEAAWTEMIKYKTSILIGAGNGFIFELEKPYAKEIRHNVHFTPMSILARHGLLVLLIFLFSMVYLVHYLLISYDDGSLEYKILVAVIVSGLFGMFFSYSIATDFLLWIFLGLALYERNNATVNMTNEVVL